MPPLPAHGISVGRISYPTWVSRPSLCLQQRRHFRGQGKGFLFQVFTKILRINFRRPEIYITAPCLRTPQFEEGELFELLIFGTEYSRSLRSLQRRPAAAEEKEIVNAVKSCGVISYKGNFLWRKLTDR